MSMSPTFTIASVLVLFCFSPIASSDQHQQHLRVGIEQTCRSIANVHNSISYQFCVDSLNAEGTNPTGRPLEMIDLAIDVTEAAKTRQWDTVTEIGRLIAKVDSKEASKLRTCNDAYADAGESLRH